MLGRIIDSHLECGLPISGERNDRRTVSNYDLLPMEDLIEDGWKEIIELKPDGECMFDTYYDDGTNIVLKYKEVA